ncbi:NUDIX domain-containing protein [Sesbania bispinosa]|nr:NUDIX domain-containing protein [Sesbania bispinosa]
MTFYQFNMDIQEKRKNGVGTCKWFPLTKGSELRTKLTSRRKGRMSREHAILVSIQQRGVS